MTETTDLPPGATWTNWVGNRTASPAHLAAPRDELHALLGRDDPGCCRRRKLAEAVPEQRIGLDAERIEQCVQRESLQKRYRDQR